MPEKTIKVRVTDRWRVVHHGKPYIKGDTLEVPTHIATKWIQSGWVTEVKAAAPRTKKT